MARGCFITRVAALFCCVCGGAQGELNDRLGPALDHPAIEYYRGPLRDPVSLLNAKLASGEARLQFDDPAGYLRSVLSALNVPVESQIAVFSKTSFQAPRIEPANPRTIFFNDSVAVAWMRGGFIELASHDPRRGMIFYTLAQYPVDQPTFARQTQCLSCHVSDASLGVPGMMVRSIFTAPDGRPMLIFGGSLVDHRTPMAERWGGYYATGVKGSMRHMGNAMLSGDDPRAMVTPATLRVESLAARFDTRNYLSAYSDAAALLVFDHQMHMQNLMTRVGWEARAAAPDAREKKELLREAAEEFVDYLLFVDEAPLASDTNGAAISSVFAKAFAARGPRDRKGRSLRDLDLRTRLLRYPCSYMIYSPAFDELPAEAKEAIYERTWRVLSDPVSGPRYARITSADRRAILEILIDTKKDLPGYFHVVG